MKSISCFVLLLSIFVSTSPAQASNTNLSTRLQGYILLQVEEYGEAWYIRSEDSKRYYMKDGDVAYGMMRFFSLGITDTDLASIPPVETTSEMLSTNSVCSTNTLANRLKGEILLQVQQHGEAWYIYPPTCKRIYLKDGEAAYAIMRFLGLGITNADLVSIEEGDVEGYEAEQDQADDAETSEPSVTPSSSTSEDPGVQIISGKYADPDIVQLADGSWKMFFGVEPEVDGNEFEIFSATSEDGFEWTVEETEILTMSTFPDVVELDDGSYRMYLQKAAEIYSAISSDGSSFEMESGVRIFQNGEYDSDGVAAPSVLHLDDGTWLMVFRASDVGAFQPTSINTTTTTLILAQSSDGLTWERGEVVVDSRQDPFDGYVDGPELFYNLDADIELRFWTSGVSDDWETSGHYKMISSDGGSTWSDYEHVSTILGGDPTYAIISDVLYMYYTVHTDGVYLKTAP
jgi:hypothetical protein